MHFEVLAEDQSGKIVIGAVLGKIFGANGPHTFRTIAYKGLGHIPRDLRGTADASKRILLQRLPQLLRGYSKSLPEEAAVVVVVDLDRRDCVQFKGQLLNVWRGCTPRPRTMFRIAIEEVEAWLLGDEAALCDAYPNAKRSVIAHYQQDSICGTWEVLADAVHPGGAARLARQGWVAVGRAKSDWATAIAPRLSLDANRSGSFHAFADGVRRLAEGNWSPQGF